MSEESIFLNYQNRAGEILYINPLNVSYLTFNNNGVNIITNDGKANIINIKNIEEDAKYDSENPEKYVKIVAGEIETKLRGIFNPEETDNWRNRP